MKRLVALFALLFVGVTLVAAQGDSQKDLALLQGEWNVVSVEKGGQTDAKYKGAVRTNTGMNYTLKLVEGEPVTGTIKLDATKTPKQIDTMPAAGRFKGKSLLGIYKIEGDTFTLCFDSEGKERPTEFASKGSWMLVVHKKK